MDFRSADIVLASATSTTSGSAKTEVKLSESDSDTGIFSGKLFLSSSTQTGKLNVGPGDSISVFYEPEHDGVGR